MQLMDPTAQPLVEEFDLLRSKLPLAGARILELGCGTAVKTRQIATGVAVREIVAAEVDPIAHADNLATPDLPAVRFVDYGAEAIAEADASFDVVLMFKSLHHVPAGLLGQALGEIHRVLRPGGHLWVSEPVFAGAFNDIVRLFHDEQQVRQQAFEALCQGVDEGTFSLVEQLFFRTPLRLPSFAAFRARVIDATHTDHRLDAALLATVRDRFEAHASPDGYCFEVPNRVDLLRRP